MPMLDLPIRRSIWDPAIAAPLHICTPMAVSAAPTGAASSAVSSDVRLPPRILPVSVSVSISIASVDQES